MLLWCSIIVRTMRSSVFDVGVAPAVADEVQTLGRASGEYDLFEVECVDESRLSSAAPRRRPRWPRCSAGGRPCGGSRCASCSSHCRFDDRPRLLGRRGVVEVDELLAVDLPLQDGEVLPYLAPPRAIATSTKASTQPLDLHENLSPSILTLNTLSGSVAGGL